MKTQLTAWAVLLLTLFTGYAFGSVVKSSKDINDTLKLCNQKPNECKFKYDILMYNETGRVPYPNPLTTKPVNKEKN